MTTKKMFLIMRHGPSIEVGRIRVCSPFGRVRLGRKARRSLGTGPIKLITAPEWDSRYTANCIARLYGAAAPIVEQSLSDEHDRPINEEFVHRCLAYESPDVIMTHYKRLDPMLAAIEKASGITLEIDKARMRHLNRAYLVDLEKGKVYVIKENN